MNQYNQSHPWGPYSPLMSLTGIALIIAASSRLSFSIIVFLFLAGIYAITLSIIYLGKSIIPERYKTVLVIMILTFISSLFFLVTDMINPVSALEIYFMVFLIPITFLSSQIVQRTTHLSPFDGITLGLKEASILGGIIIVISLVREPLGYGTFSIPFTGKTIYLLSDPIRERIVLQVFAAPPGGFILTAFLIALVRLLFFRQGSGVKTENNDD